MLKITDEITNELDEVHELTAKLRLCVTALASKHADIPAMRRIINDAQRILNDVHRLDIDAEELHSATNRVQHQLSGQKTPIQPTEYSVDFWRDADDEGLGGYRRD